MPIPRDLRAPAAVIFSVAALAWVFEIWTAYNMGAPLVRLMMPMTAAWSPTQAVAVWLMWVIMMAAMMLPSATPMILTHRRIAAQRGTPQESLVFSLAYLVTLAGFSLAATVLQWGLLSLGILSPMGKLLGQTIAGAVLVGAGLVQWTPLKDTCLRSCRTPIGFFSTGWRSGNRGAFLMGARHGIACLGCCWALMALLFVFGAMNLTAILLLATLVAAEKLLPHGDWLARLGGGILVAWGALVIFA